MERIVVNFSTVAVAIYTAYIVLQRPDKTDDLIINIGATAIVAMVSYFIYRFIKIKEWKKYRHYVLKRYIRSADDVFYMYYSFLLFANLRIVTPLTVEYVGAKAASRGVACEDVSIILNTIENCRIILDRMNYFYTENDADICFKIAVDLDKVLYNSLVIRDIYEKRGHFTHLEEIDISKTKEYFNSISKNIDNVKLKISNCQNIFFETQLKIVKSFKASVYGNNGFQLNEQFGVGMETYALKSHRIFMAAQIYNILSSKNHKNLIDSKILIDLVEESYKDEQLIIDHLVDTINNTTAKFDFLLFRD